jgi:hypothetical protein
MIARLCCVLTILSLAGCKRAPDPLAESRATCERLQKEGKLKKGLAIEECAKQVKEAADAHDPKLRAEELLTRLAALTAKGRGTTTESNQVAVRDAVQALQELNKPAVPAALARMKDSPDPDFRIAVAKALVAICANDCAFRDYDCMVPALLEGVGEDKPAEVRREAEKGLMRCTGEQLGDDPAAWKRWWAERQRSGGGQAAR